MEILPQDIKREILSKLSDRDLIHVCAANKQFYSICQDNYFWKQRSLHYFPNDFIVFLKKGGKTEKETYQLLFQLDYLRTFFPELFVRKTLKDIYETTRFNLYRNVFRKMPKEIGSLSNLKELYLNGNEIHHLPKEIGKLHNLTEMDLSKNQLQTIPKEIGSLCSLTKLYIEHNLLQAIPEEIGLLSNLKTLDLICNQIQSIPKEIASLPNLRYLFLDNNRLQEYPKEIDSSGSLHIFSWNGNPGNKESELFKNSKNIENIEKKIHEFFLQK